MQAALPAQSASGSAFRNTRQRPSEPPARDIRVSRLIFRVAYSSGAIARLKGRSGYFGRLFTAQQHDVPAIDKRQRDHSENNRRVIDMKCINYVQHASPKAQVPKISGHNQLALLFGSEPLQKKTRTEQRISEEPQDRPPVAVTIKPRCPSLEYRL